MSATSIKQSKLLHYGLGSMLVAALPWALDMVGVGLFKAEAEVILISFISFFLAVAGLGMIIASYYGRYSDNKAGKIMLIAIGSVILALGILSWMRIYNISLVSGTFFVFLGLLLIASSDKRFRGVLNKS